MVETFTPAVCGSRSRQRLALVLFSVGALIASAALGAALGFAGSLIGRTPALVAAAIIAALAALRETGALRLPLPQSRRQVPERWRSELPLPVWSAGYGAGLGIGVLTFQPVATFWVACAAALALGRPMLAAVCFALYGAGRAFMAAWPYRSESGPAAVERLVSRTGLMARANVVVLVLAVGLFALAPAAGAAVTSLGPGFDPSPDGDVLARARVTNGTVGIVVDPPDPDPSVPVSPADSPSLDGDRVAYSNGSGITVLNWRTMHAEKTLSGNLSDPALDYPLLAYRSVADGRERLVLVDLSAPGGVQERTIASVPVADDLGRPSLRGGWLAWHRIKKHETVVTALNLQTDNRRTIRRTSVWQESNPSVTATRVVWVEQRPAGSFLKMRRFSTGRTKTLMHMGGRKTFLWTTGLSARTAYVTRYTPTTGRSVVLRVDF
jgi:hypothetical protein